MPSKNEAERSQPHAKLRSEADDASPRVELLEWLRQFSECVRRRDVAAAEQLFDPNVIAFGTRNEMMKGLEALREIQWRPTWNSTTDFRFLPETIHIEVGSNGEQAWACGLWTSRGEPGDRPAYDRRGRATFGFAWNGGWRCTHSHLSLMPTSPL